eukprot:c34777_g1_i1 orf=123-389(+)
MPNGKAPRPDGLPKEFFFTNWEVVKDSMVAMYNEAWRNGGLSPAINSGLIKLIPKNSARQQVGDWRPITLLNTSYKILEKALVIRSSS